MHTKKPPTFLHVVLNLLFDELLEEEFELEPLNISLPICINLIELFKSDDLLEAFADAIWALATASAIACEFAAALIWASATCFSNSNFCRSSSAVYNLNTQSLNFSVPFLKLKTKKI